MKLEQVMAMSDHINKKHVALRFVTFLRVLILKFKYRGLCIYALIILLQVLVILYWGGIKTNFFVDELYSMVYANSFTGNGDYTLNITSSSDFKFNEWIENTEFKKYLILSDEQTVFTASPIFVIHKMLTVRCYWAFLNIAESLASYPVVSARPGILLNVLFYILSEFSLISLMNKLKINETVRYLSVVMFGFSCYILSAALYIRFYILIIMLLPMIINAFYSFWNAEKWKDVLLSLIAIGVPSYFSYKHSELALPYLGGFMLCLIAASIITKKRKQTVICSLISICGVIYFLSNGKYIDVILHASDHSFSEGVAVTAIKNMGDASFQTVWGYFTWAGTVLETYYFGSYWIIYFLAGAITICLVLSSEKKGEVINSFASKIHLRDIRTRTACTLAVWLLLLIFSVLSGRGIYTCLTVMLIVLIIAATEAAGYEFRLSNIRISSDTVFILVMMGAAGIYTIFVALCSYRGTWRYFIYGFVSFTVFFWYAVDRMLKKVQLDNTRRKLLMILTGFVIINSLIPFKSRNIEYMYEDEKQFVASVRYEQSTDVVLCMTEESLFTQTLSEHAAYDCINLMGPKANIYILDLEQYEYGQINPPSNFILWSHSGADLKQIINDIKKHGYILSEIGEDHCSIAYLCKSE